MARAITGLQLVLEKNDVKVGGGRDVADLAVSSIKNKCKPLDDIDDDDDVKHTYHVWGEWGCYKL